jgi:hypothetical protein
MQEGVLASFLSSTNLLGLEMVTGNALRHSIPATTSRERHESQCDEATAAVYEPTSRSTAKASLMDIEFKWASPVCSQHNVNIPQRRRSNTIQVLLYLIPEDATPVLWHKAVANPAA